jgi:hypothetical protein
MADPRNPANDWFVSGNLGAYPPSGALTRPVAGETVASGSGTVIDVTAIAQDDVQVTAVRLVARTGEAWVEIGQKVTRPVGAARYDWDVDLCAAGPFNGPLEVALRVWDHEGNVSAALDPRTVQVDHACPPPSSQLKPAETFDSTAVRLNWDASSAGAGIGSFELQWRAGTETWDPANTITLPGSLRSTWFAGQPGASYAFRLRALDINGQPEPWPAGDIAETTATLPDTCAQDAFEPDDTVAEARPLALGQGELRNLCGPGNPDWFKFEIEDTDLYTASLFAANAASVNGGAAARITLYGGDGATVLASGEAGGAGQDTRVFFQPVTAGVYYLKIEPLLANLFGTEAAYRLTVTEGGHSFLPLIAH